jgi:hypothetical protein
MLIGPAILAAVLGTEAGAGAGKKAVSQAVCEQNLPAVAGDAFSLVVLPAPKRLNESGVLLLINCSNRKIVSLRDPSPSRRHVNEFVYDPRIRVRLRGERDKYAFINFNHRPKNSYTEVNGYSRNTYWNGPCRFDGLELTTAAADDGRDRKTITFSLNICENAILALVTPKPAAASPRD